MLKNGKQEKVTLPYLPKYIISFFSKDKFKAANKSSRTHFDCNAIREMNYLRIKIRPIVPSLITLQVFNCLLWLYLTTVRWITTLGILYSYIKIVIIVLSNSLKLPFAWRGHFITICFSITYLLVGTCRRSNLQVVV